MPLDDTVSITSFTSLFCKLILGIRSGWLDCTAKLSSGAPSLALRMSLQPFLSLSQAKVLPVYAGYDVRYLVSLLIDLNIMELKAM